MSRTVAITGGAGFLGSHLIRRFLDAGDAVRVNDLTLIEDVSLRDRVTFVQGDVRDRTTMETLVQGADYVVHNAAIVPVARAGKEYWSVNVDGTRNVLGVAKDQGVKKVIFISTSAVYGIPKHCPLNETVPLTPLGQYGRSKFDAEQVCHEFRDRGLDVTVLRPRTLVGVGRLGIFGILFDWINRGKRVYILGKGHNLFQLLSAPDCAEGCYLMTVKPCMNEDFDLGAEVFGTVREDLTALSKHAGTKTRIVSIPPFLAQAALGLLDLFHLSPLVDWHYRTPHAPFYFDVTKAKTLLGWIPKDSNISMLAETYDWYIQHRDEAEKQTGTTHRKTTAQRLLKILRLFS